MSKMRNILTHYLLPVLLVLGLGCFQSFVLAQPSLQQLEQELAQLKSQLPQYTAFETSLEDRKQYVNRVLELLKQIAALSDENDSAGDGQRLILTGIQYLEKPHQYAGYRHEQCPFNQCDPQKMKTVLTVHVDDYPSVIRIGDPFTFGATTTYKMKKPAGVASGFQNGHNMSQVAKVELDIGGASVDVSSEKPYVINGDTREALDVNNKASLSAEFVYAGQEKAGHEKSSIHYKLTSLKKTGSFYGASVGRQMEGQTFTVNYVKGKPAKWTDLRISVNGLIFEYRWADEDEEPFKAEALPDDEDDESTVANAEDDASGDGEENTGASDEQANGQDDGQNTTANDPNNTTDSDTAYSPENPNIQALITQWIASAEPPRNATEGASLKYTKWGYVYGETETGTAGVTGPPDEAANYPSHFALLWDKKETLDSVDHCKLGEYIDAKLASKAITHCQGRYKPIVPDMVGMLAKDAQQRLMRRKLVASLKVGSPAPESAKALTVERQGTAAGESLTKQSAVVLYVYAPSVNKSTVPNVVGKTNTEAADILEAKGFKTVFSVGSAPVNQAQSKRVELQSPVAGTELKAGSSVTVKIHPVYVVKITVPNLQNYPVSEAQNKLTAMGLTVALDNGPPAQREEQSERVMNQSILPGTEVKAGTLIRLRSFSKYLPPRFIPNVLGLTEQEARQALGSVFVSPMFSKGKPAPNPSYVGRVYQQSVPPGAVAKLGGTVLVDIYYDAEEERHRQETLSALRGERPWPSAQRPQAGNPASGQPSGITVNRSREQMSAGQSSTTSSTPPSSSSTSTSSGSTESGVCGRVYNGPQKHDPWTRLPFDGTTFREYTYKLPAQSLGSYDGLKLGEVLVYKGAEKVININVVWLDKVTPQTLASFNKTVEANKQKERENKDTPYSFRQYTFESAAQYAMARSFQVSSRDGSPQLSKQEAKALVCRVMVSIEEQAAPRNGKTSPSSSTPPPVIIPHNFSGPSNSIYGL